MQLERGWRDVGQNVQGVRRINKKNKSWEASWVGGMAKLNLFFRKTLKYANAARASTINLKVGIAVCYAQGQHKF